MRNHKQPLMLTLTVATWLALSFEMAVAAKGEISTLGGGYVGDAQGMCGLCSMTVRDAPIATSASATKASALSAASFAAAAARPTTLRNATCCRSHLDTRASWGLPAVRAGEQRDDTFVRHSDRVRVRLRNRFGGRRVDVFGVETQRR